MPRADNSRNLTQKGKRISTERAQELARISAEKRRANKLERKTAREFAEMALNAEIENKKTGEKIIAKDAIIKRVIAKALQDGELNSVKYLFELIGESPEKQLNVNLKNGDNGMSRDDIVKELERLEALRKEE